MATSHQVTVLLFVAVSTVTISRADAGDAFDRAISFAQKRVAKIYGAKVGRTPGYATGLVISPDGQILTANGTYLNGDRVRVVFSDGTSTAATAARRSREDQLAILNTETVTPDYFDLAEASPTFKGQWVLALSNLFKVAQGGEDVSVMLGIVSLQTKLEAKRGNQPFPYQGDVLLLDCISNNPGSPGGAVVDAETGTLVGMIGPNLESRASGTKLNYAIPVGVLNRFVRGEPSPARIARPEKRVKLYLGIELFRLGGKRSPAYVDRIAVGSPAAKAMLRPDDLILAIGDDRIKTIEQYDEVILHLVPGKQVEVTLKRGQKLSRVMVVPAKEK